MHIHAIKCTQSCSRVSSLFFGRNRSSNTDEMRTHAQPKTAETQPLDMHTADIDYNDFVLTDHTRLVQSWLTLLAASHMDNLCISAWITVWQVFRHLLHQIPPTLILRQISTWLDTHQQQQRLCCVRPVRSSAKSRRVTSSKNVKVTRRLCLSAIGWYVLLNIQVQIWLCRYIIIIIIIIYSFITCTATLNLMYHFKVSRSKGKVITHDNVQAVKCGICDSLLVMPVLLNS